MTEPGRRAHGRLRLALVGCGAMAGPYLAATSGSTAFSPTMLVDVAPDRARRRAEEYGIAEIAEDHRKVLGRVDAAVVAVPNHLHAPVTLDLLRHGIHVLVEAPMAMTVPDCEAMLRASHDARARLAVGLAHRHSSAARFVKTLLACRCLGEPRRFEIRAGTPYRWPAATDSPFRRATGGGVLADAGVHLLDLVLWWLGDYAEVACEEDSRGGVEADCRIEMRLRQGATGVVELSRTRELRNTVVLEGDQGSLEMGTDPDPVVRVSLGHPPVELAGSAPERRAAGEGLQRLLARQLVDFADAIEGDRDPLVPGAEGARVVALLEECRSRSRPLRHAWEEPGAGPAGETPPAKA